VKYETCLIPSPELRLAGWFWLSNTPPHKGLSGPRSSRPTAFLTFPQENRQCEENCMTKSKKADFRANEFVVYPAHGVGQIISIEKQEVAGFELELFVISFEKDKMTLRVPTNKATEIGMRGLSSPDVVSQAMKTLKGKAKVKRAMWSRRAQEYEQKINSGDLIAIAEVVRDLHRSDDQREQSYSERQLYEAALERLTREVGAVGGGDEMAAAKQIDDVLVSRAA
jgi:CarD family transcriptional regulator